MQIHLLGQLVSTILFLAEIRSEDMLDYKVENGVGKLGVPGLSCFKKQASVKWSVECKTYTWEVLDIAPFSYSRRTQVKSAKNEKPSQDVNTEFKSVGLLL